MNPDTGELRRFESLNDSKGFIPIPEKLHRAANLKLGKKKSVFVSKTSGGKLSRWAAKKRKERRLQKEMVENCNSYYFGSKENVKRPNFKNILVRGLACSD